MAIIYKVKPASVCLRTGPSTNYDIKKVMKRGDTVKGEGINENGWLKLNIPSGYINSQYLEKVGEDKFSFKEVKEEPKPKVNPRMKMARAAAPKATPARQETVENMDTENVAAKNPTTENDEDYKLLNYRYIRALGSPPNYNQVVDHQYIDERTPGVGRVFAETMLSFPSILSICPGKVDYLPGFSKDQQQTFYQKVVAAYSGDGALSARIAAEDETNRLNGKLYEFKQAYNEYISIVNVLCRAVAMWLDIGEQKMPHSQTKLKDFDYAWWTSRTGSPAQDSKSIFGEAVGNIKKAIGSAVSDDTYVHFFITHQGTSVSEDLTTTTSASMLEDAINNSSLHSMSRNLEFLFGSAIGGADVESDLQAAMSGQPEFLKSFGNLAKNYLKGGRLIFPQMVDDINYSKSMTCSMKFVSIYGDKMSIFLRCYVPLLHILAMALPKQIAQNMYTYPFLVRVFQKGWFNSDLAVITNLRVIRGGQDNTSWTIDGLPTEIEVEFTVTPLYSDLMVTSSKHPFLFLQNTSLTEYLATLCSIDLKVNNLSKKIEVALSVFKNKFTDVPVALARGITDGLAAKAGDLFKIMNR